MPNIESYNYKNDPAYKKLEEILDFADNSINTKKAYRTYTAPFLIYCHDELHKDIGEVTHSDIRNYLNMIQEERDLSNRTVNHAISELKKLLIMNEFDWDDTQVPTKRISQPNLYVPLRSEVENFINKIPENEQKKKAMVAIMYSTGARVSETCHLKCSDIHRKDGFIHISDGKGRKERNVPLSDITYNIIVKYWKNLPYSMKTREWLFTQDRNIGKPADAAYIQKYLKRFCNEINCIPFTCHTFRRAFATHLYLDGVSIEKISKLMGHSSIESTLIYVHLAETLLAQSVKSPIDQLNIII